MFPKNVIAAFCAMLFLPTTALSQSLIVNSEFVPIGYVPDFMTGRPRVSYYVDFKSIRNERKPASAAPGVYKSMKVLASYAEATNRSDAKPVFSLVQVRLYDCQQGAFSIQESEEYGTPLPNPASLVRKTPRATFENGGFQGEMWSAEDRNSWPRLAGYPDNPLPAIACGKLQRKDFR